MDPLRHVKPAVRALRAYTLAERDAAVKINQNENPWDLPEKLKRRVLERALARSWSRYPPFDPTALTDALAKYAGWRPDGVLAGNGSNELIEALLMVTVGPETRVVIPEPTFTLYALLATVLGGDIERVPLTAPAPGAQTGFAYDLDAILTVRRASRAGVTVVCSPNNPTGNSLSGEDVDRLCRDGDGLVVIDEAYHEFAGASVVPLLARHPNLIVLRTFSKAMALAGLRVGYLLASPDLVREINKARLPYNLNLISQLAALEALDQPAALSEGVRKLVAERERLLKLLGDLLGVRAHRSDANFFLLELLEANPKAVWDGLARRGVLVRDVTSYPMLERCLRVSVGSPQENEAFLHALGAALIEAGTLGAEGRA
jgi:histidinol-phosphate aminotransferase